jgi:hypothetical protein
LRLALAQGWNSPTAVGGKLFFTANIDHLLLAGTTYRFLENEILQMEFVVPAVTRTRWGRDWTFTNSITGPYPGRATFEDGSQMDNPALAAPAGRRSRAIASWGGSHRRWCPDRGCSARP